MSVTASAARSTNWLNVALWVVQVFLAAMYLFAGYTKVANTPDALAASMGWGWALSVPAWFVMFIGVAELLGAIGIVLPAATRIMPWLTPLAAAGFVVVQVAAIVLHASRGEHAVLPFNLLLLAAAIFVLWGRTRKLPIAAR